MVFPATRRGTHAPYWGVNEKTREPFRGETRVLVGLGLGMGFTPGRLNASIQSDLQVVNLFLIFVPF
jgi:hypothetical protein